MRHLHPTFPCIALLFHLLSYLLIFRVLHGVVGASMQRCIFVRKIGQVLHYHMLSPVSFPPLRTYATISLLPSHQEPRHRMYFYDGDALWISSANESVQRDIFRYLEIKSPFEILYRLLYVANILLGAHFFSRRTIHRMHSRYRIIKYFI